MNLELYRIFYEIAECKNITKASEKLCISQPAVTKHLKNLEDYLGTPLFVRTKRGVVLTEAGEEIYKKVKPALALLSEAETEVLGYNKGLKGTIKIGISTTLVRRYLLPYIKKFHEMFPNITFDISTYPTKELIGSLKKGSIDFIIGKIPNKIDQDLNYEVIGQSSYIFVCTKNYPELINKKVKVKELANYPIILQEANSNARESADLYFKNNNIFIEPKMEIGSSNLLVDFVKINLGIGYVTKEYVLNELKKEELYEINIEPKTEIIDFGLITLKNNIMSYYVREFIKLLKK